MDNLFEGLSVSLPEADIEAVNERLNKLKSEWMEAAKNDADFVSSLKREAEGKVYNSVERWLKKATGADLEKVDAELKGGDRFKAALDLAIGDLKATKDHTNQELQDQLLSVKNELRKVREEEIPEIEGRYKAQFDAKNVEAALASKLPTLNVIPERMSAARIYLNAVLKDRYNTIWSDGIQIQTKDGLKPVINDRPAGTDEVISAILDEGGFIQKSNGTTPAHTPGVAPVTKAGQLSENARKMAASFGARQ